MLPTFVSRRETSADKARCVSHIAGKNLSPFLFSGNVRSKHIAEIIFTELVVRRSTFSSSTFIYRQALYKSVWTVERSLRWQNGWYVVWLSGVGQIYDFFPLRLGRPLSAVTLCRRIHATLSVSTKKLSFVERVHKNTITRSCFLFRLSPSDWEW